jgi:hypothetical protein
MFPHRPRYTAPPMAPLPWPCEQLTRLVYELLDAHDDTARIATGQNLEVHWQAHLSYLRDLQRVARGLVARTGQQEDAQTSAPVDCFAPSGGSIFAFPASSDSTTAGRHRPRDSSNREGGVR